jgi:myosin heavy subunit
VFHAGRMQDQLRCSGLVEVCRIRKLGYPVRRSFEEFYKRFRCCDLLVGSLDPLLALLTQRGVLKEGEWAKGHSKIFMRTAQSLDLELAREQAFLLVAIKVQKVARGLVCRRRFKHFKEILIALRDAIDKRTDAALTDALDMSAELPWNGVHLEVVKVAKVLQSRVREENRVLALLQNALAVMELNGLISAINAASSMDPPFTPPILVEVRAAVTKLQAEIACKNGLAAAIAARSLSDLVKMIAEARSLNFDCGELHQAIALKARIDEENALLENLRQACVDRELDLLNVLVSKCAELGIETREEVTQAKVVIKDLLEELARIAAAEAEAEKQRLALQAAAEEAERQRLAVEAAQLKRQQAMEEADRNLAEAVEALDFPRLNDALNKAMELGLESSNLASAQVGGEGWCDVDIQKTEGIDEISIFMLCLFLLFFMFFFCVCCCFPGSLQQERCH